MGPAIRKASVLQGSVRPSDRVARLHALSGRGQGRARTLVHRNVQVLGTGDDRALPRERAARSHRLVRPVTQHPGSQRLRRLLRQLPEPDHQSQRRLPQLDRRATPLDRARLAGPAGHLDLLAALRVAHRFPVVGRRRVPGLRRRAQSIGPAAARLDVRFLAHETLAVQEIPLHRRPPRLQRVRRRQRARRAIERNLA